MMDIEQIKADRDEGTDGPWVGCNMVHVEGRSMTPDEIGEYVRNSVKMGVEGKFLFVSGKHDDGGDCDICHTGNGPKGDANTRRISRVPDLELAFITQSARIEELEAQLSTARNDALDEAVQACERSQRNSLGNGCRLSAIGAAFAARRVEALKTPPQQGEG